MLRPKVLVLAQTPPPMHGQSVMLKYLVDAEWNWCDKKHIRLEFTSNINNISKFSLRKVFVLLKIICDLLIQRLNGKIDIIFYPPCGPKRIPFYRDIILIPILKIISRKTIFQFHAGAFDQLLNILNPLERRVALKIYHKPDLAITLLPYLNKEVTWIKPKKVSSIPNGVIDVYHKYAVQKQHPCTVLFVGNLIKEKGLSILLEAVTRLNQSNEFNVKIMGGWQCDEYKKEVLSFIEESKIRNVSILGVKHDDEKWNEYASADIFCLPTYETEAMPISIIEAMMFSLPIVTTNWRAIPDIIENEVTGILVPIKEAGFLADNLELLVNSSELRLKMGALGREKYLREYTLEKHLERMESIFRELSGN